MSYQHEYTFITSMRSKSVSEMHSELMSMLNLAQKVLGTIHFTEEKSFRQTFNDLENNVLYLIDNIQQLQHLLRIREQNESRRIIYEENCRGMMPGYAFMEEFNSVINHYYEHRMTALKDITQISHQGGDVLTAKEIAQAKKEEEDKNTRQLLNHLLMRYVVDIEVMHAKIERMTNGSTGDMY